MKALCETDVQVDAEVSKAALRLAQTTRAEAVLLFGSRARGDCRRGSDWDLCVVLPDDVEPGKFTAITLSPLAAAAGECVEVYPIRRSVFEKKRHDINTVSHDVDRDGVLLLGAL